jgi:hypothetical protein
MYGSQESVSSSSSNSFGREVIEWAAFLLGSSVTGIYSDISGIHTDVYTNPNLSMEENARVLVNMIRAEREAEKKYFKDRPYLNP